MLEMENLPEGYTPERIAALVAQHEKMLEYRRKYSKTDRRKEHARENAKKYYDTHKEEVSARRKAYYDSNKEKIRERALAYYHSKKN
jgi:ElaB/YqjD/DUF883 family membrane-anchored ribosome-binding protein